MESTASRILSAAMVAFIGIVSVVLVIEGLGSGVRPPPGAAPRDVLRARLRFVAGLAGLGISAAGTWALLRLR